MQYQFLLNDLKESDQIQSELVGAGVLSDQIHFVSETSEDFAGHHVNQASLIEERDILHSGLRWGTVGLLAGLLVGLAVDLFEPYGWQPQAINIVLFCLLGAGFGGWSGGLIGISHRNYRLSQHEDELQRGKAIMLVYGEPVQGEKIKSVVLTGHPDARFLGQESDYDNPFNNRETVELED